jgi:hypothetical protein
MMLAQVCVRLFIFVRPFSSSAREESRLFCCSCCSCCCFCLFDDRSTSVGGYRDYCCYYYDHTVSRTWCTLTHCLFSSFCGCCYSRLPGCRPQNTPAHEGHAGRQPKHLLLLLSAAPAAAGENTLLLMFFRLKNKKMADAKFWMGARRSYDYIKKQLPFFANVLLLVTICCLFYHIYISNINIDHQHRIRK